MINHGDQIPKTDFKVKLLNLFRRAHETIYAVNKSI